MKTYNIMLSKVFPATHPRNGELTFFRDKLLAAVFADTTHWQKLHTIRENYPLWLERIKQVQAGEAQLCIRQWTGKPYRSKTVEVIRLGWQNGVGIQKLNFGWHDGKQIPVIKGWCIYGDHGSKAELARNDGLTLQDWQDWFKSHEQDTMESDSMAIIHFTNFRY